MVHQLSLRNQGHKGLVGPWSTPKRNTSMQEILVSWRILHMYAKDDKKTKRKEEEYIKEKING